MKKKMRKLLCMLLIACMMAAPCAAQAEPVAGSAVETVAESAAEAESVQLGEEESAAELEAVQVGENESSDAAGEESSEESSAEESSTEESSEPETTEPETTEPETTEPETTVPETKPMKQGLQTESGKLYYYIDDVKQIGLKTVNGATYYFTKDGSAFTKGFLTFDKSGKTVTSYFGTDGKQALGYRSASKIYKADSTGKVTDVTKKSDNRAYIQKNGEAFNKGFLQFIYNNKTYYYFFGTDGFSVAKGYVRPTEISVADKNHVVTTKAGVGDKYYFDQNGRAFTSGILNFNYNGKSYVFFCQSNGKAFTGGYKTSKVAYTANDQCVIKKTYDGTTAKAYYFPSNGCGYKKKLVKCKGYGGKVKVYYFGADGVAKTSGVAGAKTLYVEDTKKLGKTTAKKLSPAKYYKYDSHGIGKLANGWQKVGSTRTYFESGVKKFASNAMYNAWKSIKDRSSSTRYFVVVDTKNCRTFTFKGSAGNWKPLYLWKCSPGKSSTPTPKGTFYVGGRGYCFHGKNGDNYTCYYYTQFYGNYLFHSILYWKNTFNVRNGTLGKNLSHGCVRLSLENAKWFYNNLPSGTKVYIYG